MSECYFCGEIATGQCPDCGRFLCSSHGDGLCSACKWKSRASVLAVIMAILITVVSYPLWLNFTTSQEDVFSVAICGLISCWGVPSLITGIATYFIIKVISNVIVAVTNR